MKIILVTGGMLGVGGLLFGLTYNLNPEVKSMLIGQLMLLVSFAVIGIILMLTVGVYTRNTGGRQQNQRGGGDFGYHQSPMIVMGQPHPQQQIEQGYMPRQLPMLDLKAEKEQEFVEW